MAHSMNPRTRLIAASLAAALFSFAAPPARAANDVANRDELRRAHGLDRYSVSSRVTELKIAVLDNGFEGFDAARALLPASAELLNLTPYPAAASRHGLGMAQIAWAMLGKPVAGPKFLLINTNGYSNFKAAIDYVVEQRVDIVLYAQVWPLGGNYDGKGFINEQVNRATRAGVIWLNAAGNFHDQVHNGRVQLLDPLAPPFRFENKFDENEVTLTLTWSDFQESDEHLTRKDLDVIVLDAAGRTVGSGELVQKGEAPPAGATSTLSAHARESVVLRDLDRGTYRIQLVNKSGNFAASDSFRILLKGDKPVEFTDRTTSQEIQAPADNASVLTVGDLSELSSIGPTADGRVKPEVLVTPSQVSFTNGQKTDGSSVATALFAGIVATLKAQEPALTADTLRRLALAGGGPIDGGGSSGSGDEFVGEGNWLQVDGWVVSMVPPGSRIKRHRNGFQVVLTPQDPLSYPGLVAAGAHRRESDDLILALPSARRFGRHPRARIGEVSAPWVEFRRNGASYPAGSNSPTPLPVGADARRSWRTPTVAELRSAVLRR